uniref:Uncharacterized protein n=1 Tax=Ciona intestinalis TaxID=7719 RepID=H2Y387_CIOIN
KLYQGHSYVCNSFYANFVYKPIIVVCFYIAPKYLHCEVVLLFYLITITVLNFGIKWDF